MPTTADRERFEDLFVARAEMNEREMMEFQVQSAMSEIGFVVEKLDALCDRTHYYGDEINEQHLRDIQAMLKRIVRNYA